MSTLRKDESPLERAMLIEKEFAVIPSYFLLEKRIAGTSSISIFKGMDLLNNVPVTIKYIKQEAEVDATQSQIGRMDYAQAKRRFEREAQAFGKLEKHRRVKEKAVNQLLETAERDLEEGKKEGDREKVRAALEMKKLGNQLKCDRHFVKAYCLATGTLHNFDIGEDGNFVRQKGETVAFMVMEYLNAQTLEQILEDAQEKKSFLPINTIVPILEGILEALEYCHEEGIIHRDIQPANIFVGPNSKVRISNLGLAKVEDMTQLTSQGAFVGTVGYAAPEGIVRGKRIPTRLRAFSRYNRQKI